MAAVSCPHEELPLAMPTKLELDAMASSPLRASFVGLIGTLSSWYPLGEEETEAQKPGWHQPTCVMPVYLPKKKKQILTQSSDQGALPTALPLCQFLKQGSSLRCKGPTLSVSWLLQLLTQGQTSPWRVHLKDQQVYQKKK